MSDTTLDLETLLREKEELIDALTERLELTAEQLDRQQRANGDRGHWLSGGVPVELVEQQQNLCLDLERVVHQWEDAQPGAALSRIEMQLQELRDLFVQNPAGSGGGARYSEHSRARAVAPEPEPDASPSEQSAWEALKAGLLSQDGADVPEAGHHQDHQAHYESAAPVYEESAGPDPFDSEPPLDPPEAIDLDSADSATLRNAVLARDEFIAEVLRRLRSVEGRTRPSDTWKTIENVPDELRSRLESLERRLEQTLRMSEVELSRERAKLGREAARIKQLEEATQKAADRVGLALAEHDRADAEEDEPENRADGRWARMLGRGKRDR